MNPMPNPAAPRLCILPNKDTCFGLRVRVVASSGKSMLVGVKSLLVPVGFVLPAIPMTQRPGHLLQASFAPVVANGMAT